jgi:plasmid stabilization system protein ParE
VRVRYTIPAQADLEEIYTYLWQSNPHAAERVKRQIKTDVDLLGELPLIACESDSPGLRIPKVRRYP